MNTSSYDCFSDDHDIIIGVFGFISNCTSEAHKLICHVDHFIMCIFVTKPCLSVAAVRPPRLKGECATFEEEAIADSRSGCCV